MLNLRAILSAALFLFLLPHEGAAQTTDLKALRTQNDARVWRAVGRLDARGVGFCTGTLIAPELVLTAAHCVYDPRTGKAVAARDLTFSAGLHGDKAAARRTVGQVVAHPGYTPGTPISSQNVRHDVALLRLTDPIPTSLIDPFILHQGDVGQAVSVVSYGRGRADYLSRQSLCQVMQNRDRILTLDCDVTFGSSGSPVFTHINGRGRIVSVISGTGHFSGKRAAFGMTLDRVVADLKTQLRAGAPRPAAKVRRIGTGSNKNGTGAKFIRADGS